MGAHDTRENGEHFNDKNVVSPKLRSLEAYRMGEAIKNLLAQGRRTEADSLITQFVETYCMVSSN